MKYPYIQGPPTDKGPSTPNFSPECCSTVKLDYLISGKDTLVRRGLRRKPKENNNKVNLNKSIITNNNNNDDNNSGSTGSNVKEYIDNYYNCDESPIPGRKKSYSDPVVVTNRPLPVESVSAEPLTSTTGSDSSIADVTSAPNSDTIIQAMSTSEQQEPKSGNTGKHYSRRERISKLLRKHSNYYYNKSKGTKSENTKDKDTDIQKDKYEDEAKDKVGSNLNLIPKSNRKRSHKHKNKKRHNKDDGPISLAILTEDGILIKSRKPKSYEYKDYSNMFATNGRTSMSSSTTSFNTLGSDSESFLETASSVSCVTCLSDSVSSLSMDSSSITSTSTTNTNSSNVKSNSSSSTNSNFTNDSSTFKRDTYASVNGQLPTNSVIPYNVILNAKHIDVTKLNKDRKRSMPNIDVNSKHTLVEITFAKPRRQDVVPKRLTLIIEYIPKLTENENEDVVEEILIRSYKNSKRHRNILVIINPFGGKRNAKKLFMKKSKRLLMASGFKFDIKYTQYCGHGIEITQHMNIDKYDTILCASGDGIPHEVINGLYRRPDRVEAFNKLAITQVPCGSGNAMSVSCHWTNNPSYATLFLIKSIETRCDIMCMSQPSYKDGIPKLSFLSQTYGIIADSDINTEFIRWLGPARFELGVAFNILQRKKYPCDLYVKYFTGNKNDLKTHYLDEIDKINERTERNKYNRKNGYDYNYDDDEEEEVEDIDHIVTESTFKVKYPLGDPIPDDWVKIDSSITDNLSIFYTGKMPYVAADTKFFPAALPSDGVMDMVLTDSRTPFTRMIPILLALDKGSHVLQPEVVHSKIYAYKLIPKNVDKYVNNEARSSKENKNPLSSSQSNEGLFSIDGEKFPLEPLQVEIIPKLCKFLLRDGKFVDTEFGDM